MFPGLVPNNVTGGASSVARVARLVTSGPTLVAEFQPAIPAAIKASGGFATEAIDLSATAANFQQASVGHKPSFVYDGPKRLPCLTFGFGAAHMARAHADVAPTALNPFVRYWVGRLDRWQAGANDYLMADDAGTGFICACLTASPNVISYDGTALNANMPIGTWVRVLQVFDGTAASYVKIGSAAPTVGNAGNLAAISPRWLGWVAQGRCAGWSLAQLAEWRGGFPTGGELSAMDAIVASWGVQV